MNKEQIETLKDIIKIFNKASFNVSGPDLIDIGNRLKKYAQLITQLEDGMNKEEIK